MLVGSRCSNFRSERGPKAAARKLPTSATFGPSLPARSRRATHGLAIARIHRGSFGRAITCAVIGGLFLLATFGVQAAEYDVRRLAVTSPLPPFGEAEPIPAWVGFCTRYPGECAVDVSEPAVLELTAAAWSRLEATNEHVNSTVKTIPDVEHRGVVDHWDLPDDGYGDCEDYQLLKRKLLAEIGFPRRAMRMTVVLDETGQGHAVLMIRTDRGDYILDNRRQAVLAWRDTGYEYIKQEGPEGSGWVALNGSRGAPAVTSR